MSYLIQAGIDITVIAVICALFVHRHKRRDLLVAFLVANFGVFAIAAIFGDSSLGLGAGLGLFGVLSIIRLRSTEISQSEVAYYFAALATGVVLGLTSLSTPAHVVAILLILLGLAVGDSTLLRGRLEHAQIRLDHAYANYEQVNQALTSQFDIAISRVEVVSCDLINDSMLVDVWYTPTPARTPAPIRTASPLREAAFTH